MQGIVVTGDGNTIGGDSSAGDGNVIAAAFPGAGILVDSADANVIQGNTIGLGPDGNTVGAGVNGDIRLVAATNTVIGNDVTADQLSVVQAHPEFGNVLLSASGAPAILLDENTIGTLSTDGTKVAGNFIGVNRNRVETATTPGHRHRHRAVRSEPDRAGERHRPSVQQRRARVQRWRRAGWER